MLAFILFLILVCVALGIIGFVVKGLFMLFVVACVLFALILIGSALRGGRHNKVIR
ncbi:MAG TPA: hypothetical protein VF218_00070 [Acidothermaceae bacterium]|jgi:hypothetical protein